jgi:chromosome segregation ATPase
MTKDLEDFLDIFGINRNNPYNIVHQGTIEKISLHSETEILNLLEEVSGISIYENKKEESLKYLKESEQDSERIEIKLLEIEKRIN